MSFPESEDSEDSENHFQNHLKPAIFSQDPFRSDGASSSRLRVFKFLFLAMYKFLQFNFFREFPRITFPVLRN